MIDKAVYDILSQILPQDQIKTDEPMSGRTSFKIGGPADLYILINNEEQLMAVVKCLEENDVPYLFLGLGSNVLVGDKGINGAVLRLSGDFDSVVITEDEDGFTVKAGAGISMGRLAQEALKMGAQGFEFAAGIPGTLGGGVFMNAGAYNGELKDIVTEVTVLEDGKICVRSNEEMKFKYRYSILQKTGGIALWATMKLKKGDPAEIKAYMDELMEKRRSKQPLEYPSAGSTFKRPEGLFAGKLISDCELKGYTVGGACVSEKHAGFVVNKGGATAKDVRTLMDDVVYVVEEKFGVTLEPEVRFLGEF